MLHKDLIDQPSIWQLVLEISAQAIEVVAFSPYENHSLIHESIPLAPDAESHLRAVEDAVYDNPLLLADFAKVTVLFDTQRFLPLPSGLGKAAQKLLRKAFPPQPDIPASVIAVGMPSLGMTLAMELPDDMLGFLRRTFHRAVIIHPLVPQAVWLRSKYPARHRGKTLVNLRPDRTDVVILGDEEPLILNTFRVSDPMDSLYYILAGRQVNGLEPTDEIFIAGNRRLRNEVGALLRRYVSFVMPAIFPSVMFRAVKASLGAPFEMILAPVVADLIEPEE